MARRGRDILGQLPPFYDRTMRAAESDDLLIGVICSKNAATTYEDRECPLDCHAWLPLLEPKSMISEGWETLMTPHQTDELPMATSGAMK